MDKLLWQHDIMDIIRERFPHNYSDDDYSNQYYEGYGDALNDIGIAVSYLPPAESEILSDFKNTLFGIGEICVDVSKCDITAEEGIRQIRDRYLDVMYRKVMQNE